MPSFVHPNLNWKLKSKCGNQGLTFREENRKVYGYDVDIENEGVDRTVSNSDIECKQC